MPRGGFISVLNAIARESARRQRQVEINRRRQESYIKKQERESLRLNRLKDKGDKQRYLESRFEETEDKNIEISQYNDELSLILEHTLSVDDTIKFESLKIKEIYIPILIPQELTITNPVPNKQQYLSKVKTLSFLENALGLKKRYQKDLQSAEMKLTLSQKTVPFHSRVFCAILGRKLLNMGTYRPLPQAITVDNGSEFISKLNDYNVSRPHSAIGNLPPSEFAERFKNLASEGQNLNLKVVHF